MDRAEALSLAKKELDSIRQAGYGAAAEHIDTVQQKCVTDDSGHGYDLEVSYLWEDLEHENILVICRVTSKTWFAHERLEASVTLAASAA